MDYCITVFNDVWAFIHKFICSITSLPINPQSNYSNGNSALVARDTLQVH